jgi:hypothetical protein
MPVEYNDQTVNTTVLEYVGYVSRYVLAYDSILSEYGCQPGSGETLVRAGLAHLPRRLIEEIEHVAYASLTDLDCRRAGVCLDGSGNIAESRRSAGYRKSPVPDHIRWTVWERDDFRCQHCGSRRALSVDHIHPESKGGTLELSNLQTLCRPCNSRKGYR